MVVIMAVLAVAAGFSFAVQGAVNSALGKRTSVLQASAVSFFGGVLVLFLVQLTQGIGALGGLAQVKPWQLLGGLYGALGVCSSVTAMPVLGAALSLILILFGQLILSALIDGFGLLGVAPSAISALRVLGLAAVAAGIVLIYLGSRGGKEAGKGSEASGTPHIKLMVAVFFLGSLGALQSPTNSSLATLVGSTGSTFVSFCVGFLGIFMVLLITSHGKLCPMRGVGIKPWMVIGGLLGSASIFCNVCTIGTLGSALQSVCLMAGQFLGGVLIDSFGLLQSPRLRINRLRLAGVAAVLIGVVMITLDKIG